jgi:2-pyrone-4,6-dicarboxylate lactonase
MERHVASEPLISLPLRPLATISRPTFELPPQSWDTHVHVFGPAQRYPHVARPRYTLPDGTIGQYRGIMALLRIGRFVLVQPSFYGTDNSCLADTLSACGEIARGVAMVEPQTSESQLRQLHEVGVRAIRLDLFKRAEDSLASIRAYIDVMAEKARLFGWHLQFYTPGHLALNLLDHLARVPVDFVLDHMGYLHERQGCADEDLARLLDLLGTGHCYLKLSGSYRIAQHASDQWIDRVGRAIVARAPERALWGSDWPHISFSDVDTGEITSRLARWAPSVRERQMILVENPRRLFAT